MSDFLEDFILTLFYVIAAVLVMTGLTISLVYYFVLSALMGGV